MSRVHLCVGACSLRMNMGDSSISPILSKTRDNVTIIELCVFMYVIYLYSKYQINVENIINFLLD